MADLSETRHCLADEAEMIRWAIDRAEVANDETEYYRLYKQYYALRDQIKELDAEMDWRRKRRYEHGK